MKYLKTKFFDSNNLIDGFLETSNCLKKLESDQIPESVKKQFGQTFIKGLQDKNVINAETINAVNEKNPWSIDFPSWHGTFDESKGKKIFVIGSEPHIHHKYLQTVYGLNSTLSPTEYIKSGHPIFKFLSSILHQRFGLSQEEVIEECYLTDLFPLSPFRGNGLKIGSTNKIQKVIGYNDNWPCIRYRYAKLNLIDEIEYVKPEVILTQGKEVFYEVLKILGIVEKAEEIAIIPKTGKKQYVRVTKWNNISVISVPHVGSKRMRTFWNENLNAVKEIMNQL
jgi:hypothetical protein